MIPVYTLLDLLLSQDGDPYSYGVENDPADPDPVAHDCSEFIQWACGYLHVEPVMPDGASAQFRHSHRYGLLTSVAKAIQTPGALLGWFRAGEDPLAGPPPSGQGHIAVSLGNGKTIEARSTYFGVGQFDATARKWTIAGLIPGVDYTKHVESEDDMRNYLTVDQDVVETASARGYFKKADGTEDRTQATIDYYAKTIVSELNNPNSTHPDVSNFWKAITRGMFFSPGGALPKRERVEIRR